MKNYVAPELRWIIVNAQDVITASNDVEFNVNSWLSGAQSISVDGGFGA